jgi:hypothetical protein
MDIIQAMFATYPEADVTLQNFVDALTPGAAGFTQTLATVLITFLLGFLVYVYSFLLVDREKSGPYPLWMHTFYCAADFMGIWVFLCAWNAYDHFWFFLLGVIGEIVWVCFELYCLMRAVTYERVEIWGKDATLKQAVLTCVMQVVIFFAVLNLLRVELHDESMFKFWIFTQVIICCAPGLFWEQRKTRIGACWQLNIVLVLVAVMSFNPANMWALIAPQFFSVANNPWYYVMGAVTLFFALRGCWVYAKLPAKPDRLPDGKKPIW